MPTATAAAESSALPSACPALRAPNPGETLHFQEKGFVYLRAALDPAALRETGVILERKAREKAAAKAPEGNAFKERSFLQLTGLALEDAELRRRLLTPGIGRFAADLMGCESVRLFGDHVLIKEPGGTPTAWHTDAYYIPLDTDKVCAVWIPFRSLEVMDGALGFIPQTHTDRSLRTHPISEEGARAVDAHIREHGLKPEIEPFQLGDCSVHYASLLHGTMGNTGTEPRMIITIFIADAEARLNPRPENAFQEQHWPVVRDTRPGERLDDAAYPVLYTRPR